jgi:multisubunit Na+/H+ antiporter MnhG subunit
VAIGAGLRIWTIEAAVTLVLVVILQLLTTPVATNVTARAVHLRSRVPLDGEDELARDEAAGRSIGVPDPDDRPSGGGS